MVHAYDALPRLQLDAKRIAATSGVIALHVGVLMMLMIPMRTVQTEPEPEQTLFWEVPKTITPPPPPPALPIPHPQLVHETPIHVPVAIPDPPVEPVDQTVGTMDTAVVEITKPSDTFEVSAGASQFVQLAIAKGPAPPYPRMAETRHITGTVTLRIRVDASGNPADVSVETSSGSAILDQAAQKFVKAHWRFVPATSDGVPVEAWGLVPIEFVLD